MQETESYKTIIILLYKAYPRETYQQIIITLSSPLLKEGSMCGAQLDFTKNKAYPPLEASGRLRQVQR